MLTRWLAVVLVAIPTASVAAPRGPFVGLELYAGADEIVSPLVVGVAPAGDLEVAAGWAMAWAVDTGAVEPGNPFVSLTASTRAGELVIRPGVALSPPTTLYTASTEDERSALFGAAALRGNSGFGLFAPGMLSVVPSIQAEWRRGVWTAVAHLLAAGSLELARGEGVVRRDLAVEAIATVGADVASGIHVGSRLQGAYVPTLPATADRTQASVAPFMRVFGARGFTEARLTLALDPPLGFGGGAHVWSFALVAGAAL